ncbi:hypothetical protein [Actinophytocola sp.]|uniref:hypothetical protein n=1 Tax=Actinophytocola sp. TaxID=1872138 RepID=UPI002ED350AD
MPIRTNRGRAAVYRRLWGWPMRSPRHLAVLVFVVAVLVVAAGIVVPQLTGADDRKQGAAPETTGTSTTTAPAAPGGTSSPPGNPSSSMQTRITAPTETPTSAPADPAALDVADSFGRAWVNHPQGMTNEQWRDNLRPFTQEEYLDTEMATVDPANIVATKVTGEPKSVESYTSSVKVRLPTDDGDLLITVIDTPDGWRVSVYEQVD